MAHPGTMYEWTGGEQVHFSRSAAGRIFFRPAWHPCGPAADGTDRRPAGWRAGDPAGVVGHLSLRLWQESVLIDCFDGLGRRFLTRGRRPTISAQEAAPTTLRRAVKCCNRGTHAPFRPPSAPR